MKPWDQLADIQTVKHYIQALKTNGIDAKLVEVKKVKEKVLSFIPKGAEVMTNTSVTLTDLGIDVAINQSGNYNAIRDKLYAMDRKTQGQERNKLGAAPQFSLGSVHAVTQDGKVLIASNSGSQLPQYAYGAGKVIWVVGTQKIVKDTDEGIKRIYEYCLPLESQRAQKAYGVTSGVSKLLIINKEKVPGRITLIFVNKKLGF